MALQSCPECSGQVSSQAVRCPHCGHPNQQAGDAGSPAGSANISSFVVNEALKPSLQALERMFATDKISEFANTVVPQDIDRWRSLAEKGDADAQCLLGVAYIFGVHVGKSPEEGIKALYPAHERGHALANLVLGTVLMYGVHGLRKDVAAALPFLESAGRNGQLLAQLSLAEHYAEEPGNESNLTAAIGWYERAAGQGSVNAQLALGKLHLKNRTPAKARSWFEKADQNDDIWAPVYLAQLYLYGHGVAVDYAKAQEYLLRATIRPIEVPKELMEFATKLMFEASMLEAGMDPEAL